MKNFYLLLITLIVSVSAEAAFLRNVPQIITQPDGTILHCFASGDEYHHWLHDSLGYTIVLNTETGYFTYADVVNDELVPTKYIAGKDVLPESIRPYRNISTEAWQEKRKKQANNLRTRAKTIGTLNNIVIFLRFSDDMGFTTGFDVYDQMFNDDRSDANSMKNYYSQSSYGKLTINTFFYPEPHNGNVYSYQDSYPRNYYRKYSATNPQGYSDAQRNARLQTLLRNAVLAVRDEIPDDLNPDFNDDGLVDNICFIVKGDVEGWSDLLWPQMNNFEDAYYVSINGKRCYNYNFQMEDYTLGNVGVLCHEMFHSLGAPDLYHYPSIGDYPVGEWDIMELTTEPPQSMGAYMKFKYGNWIDDIPSIDASGFYELNPLISGDTGVCYKIPVPETDGEYIMVEYRLKSGVFEGALPASGLLIYRIWPHANGNQYPNGTTVFDEVYIYRPGGGYANNWNQSAFSVQNGRSNFHRDITDPACVLTNMAYGSIGIHHIHQTENNTIRFYVAFGDDPFLFTKEEIIYLPSASNSSQTIDVHTNLSSWDVSVEAEWLTVSKNEAGNQLTFATTSSNSSTGNRSASVIISGGYFEQTIRIIQYAGQTSLTVSPRTQTVSGEANSSAEYTVTTTYTDWSANTSADWVNLNIDLENNILTAVAVTSNTLSSDRQAVIRVTSGTTQANVFFVQTPATSIKTKDISDIHIYPNPVEDILNIIDEAYLIKEVSLYNIVGKKVLSTKPNNRQSTFNLNLSSLPKGAYLLRMDMKIGNITKKIIKK